MTRLSKARLESDITSRIKGSAGKLAVVSVLLVLWSACHAPAEHAYTPFVFATKRFDVHAEEDSAGLRELARWAEDCLEVIEEVVGPLPAGVRPELLPFTEARSLRHHADLGASSSLGIFKPGRPPRMLLTLSGCPVGVRQILVHELVHWYASETAPRAAPWLVEAASEWLEWELIVDDGEEAVAHEARRIAALGEARRLLAGGTRPSGALANGWFVAYALCERASEEDGTLGERLGQLLRMTDEEQESLVREYQKALAADLWKGGPPRRFLK